MAKFIPTAGFITFATVVYYAIDINATFDVEQGDVTDGNTGGDGREFLAGRVARSITCKLFLQDGTAEPVEGATGAFLLTAKVGASTNKSWAWTNGTIVNKGITINPAGSDPAFATYTFQLDGATTAVQLT
jgi:hypothetical protein